MKACESQQLRHREGQPDTEQSLREEVGKGKEEMTKKGWVAVEGR